MVDRGARDELGALIERYLGEEIMAFEFDAAINELSDATEDATVRELVIWLWFHYDDIRDHKVVATKEDWDFFQRVLLLLRSDGQLLRTGRRRWTIRQPIAACGVMAFGVAALTLGFPEPSLLACIPLGGLSAMLDWWRDRGKRSCSRDGLLAYPFSSVSEMLDVRRRVESFAKRRYPGHLRGRTIRHQVAEAALRATYVPILWCLISPLMLLRQSLPEYDSDYWSVTH